MEYKNKYLEMKEKYDLLVYKKFVRSAEQLLAEEKQPLLFSVEAEGTEVSAAPEAEAVSEVKAYSRKKPGRKALDASLLRVEKVVDLAESEKTCVCGTKLTWPKNVLFQMKNLFYLKNCLFFVFV